MEKLKQKMMELWKDEEGATMVEYGIMVALIAAVCIAIIVLIGDKLLAAFTTVENALP
jgi:pilus assembly protein Flp/PilA